MIVDKRSQVLDPASELALMDTELDLALPSKEGALIISPVNRMCGFPVDSKNKSVKDFSLWKIASYGGKYRVP